MALARWQATITDEAGNIKPGASVTVRREVAGAPLANLYSDRDGAVPAGNPITADGEGFAAFHVTGGAYRITATLGGFSREWRYVAVGLAQESDSLTTGLSYQFDDATADADPGEGLIRFNNATLASVTQIFVSELTGAGADVGAFLDTLDDVGDAGNRGQLMIQTGDLSGFLLCQVTGSVVDATGYKKISVTPLASSGAFGDLAGTLLQFSMRGGGLASPVAYADIQDVSATSRILGRRTAGAGVIEECTLSQVLDFLGLAQGDILFKGASGWERLAAGNAGQVLRTGGAGASPIWSGAKVLLTSGVVSNQASLDLVLTAYAAFRGLQLVLTSIVPATDDSEIWLRLSTDGGSSFDATGYSRIMTGCRDTDTVQRVYASGGAVNQIVLAGNTATAGESVSNVAAEGGANVILDILDQANTGKWPRVKITHSDWFGATQTDTYTASGAASREATQDTDGLRVLSESGNISLNYALYGYG